MQTEQESSANNQHVVWYLLCGGVNVVEDVIDRESVCCAYRVRVDSPVRSPMQRCVGSRFRFQVLKQAFA